MGGEASINTHPACTHLRYNIQRESRRENSPGSLILLLHEQHEQHEPQPNAISPARPSAVALLFPPPAKFAAPAHAVR